MPNIAAFIGHSFAEEDESLVRRFLDFFNALKDLIPGFTWDHAEPAEPKILSQKVIDKTRGKNLFVGICTGKEYAIAPNHLERGRVRKSRRHASAEHFELKTSDWILQEIGLALGREGMTILLLLEEGVRRPGGLQGDVEYIQFQRKQPDRSFKKVLEFLSSLKPTLTTQGLGTPEPQEALTPEESSPPEDHDLSEPRTDWSKDDYYRANLLALFRRDSDLAERVRKAFLASEHSNNTSERVDFLAHDTYFRHAFLKENSLEKLLDLQHENAQHPTVLGLLGRTYSEYKEFQRAAVLLLDAAGFATEPATRYGYLLEAASAFGRAGDQVLCQDTLNKARINHNAEPSRIAKLLETLRDIAASISDDDSFLAFAEGHLELQAEEHRNRFNLAYKYSMLGEEDLALYHYLLIADRHAQETSWNNIGVCRTRLDLPARAVEAYRTSVGHGGTLALSNMAQGLIEGGFLAEAKELCDKATATDGYDEQIGTAIAAIKQRREAESEREREILNAIRRKREFLLEFAMVCTAAPISELSGQWKGEDHVLTLTVSGSELNASATYDVRSTSDVLATFVRPRGDPRPATRRVVIRIHATLGGQGGKYEAIKTQERTEIDPFSEEKTTGLLYFSEDFTSIKLYQKGSRETERFLTYERVPVNG